MAEAKVTETFEAPIDKVYKMLTSYADYAEYIDGTDAAEVLEQDENGAKVRFQINVMKKFNYVLQFTHEAPTKISWEFVEGDLFKQNDGSWELVDNGDGSTDATYTLELGFKLMVPKMILKKLMGSNFPNMMQNHHDWLEEL